MAKQPMKTTNATKVKKKTMKATKAMKVKKTMKATKAMKIKKTMKADKAMKDDKADKATLRRCFVAWRRIWARKACSEERLGLRRLFLSGGEGLGREGLALRRPSAHRYD